MKKTAAKASGTVGLRSAGRSAAEGVSGAGSRRVTLGDWTFRSIRLRDKELFEEYTRKCEYPANLWSANFAYLWADSQSDERKLLWKIVDGLLVPFALIRGAGLHLACLPLGPGGPDAILGTVYRCMKFAGRWNRRNGLGPSTLRTVNDAQLAFLKESKRYRAYFDHKKLKGLERHFDAAKLSELAGKDFADIRYKINRFRKDHPGAVIRPCTPADFEQLVQVNRKWEKSAGRKYAVIFDTVYFYEILRRQKELDHRVLVVELDGRIVGLVTGGITPAGQSWGCLIKRLADINGLNETMIVEFARDLRKMKPDLELLNVGSDLGAPGLVAFKEKFRPALSLGRYRLSLRD